MEMFVEARVHRYELRKSEVEGVITMTTGYTLFSRFEPQDELIERNSEFCLCGRDPDSVEVRRELIKAIALSMRFGLVQDGCLCDAAAAFDEIFASLVPDEVQNLEQIMQDIEGMIEVPGAGSELSIDLRPEGPWLH